MKKTILILAANPKNTKRVRLDQEVREITQGLQRAQKRDEFVLEQQWATRTIEVRRAMLDYKPNIVHFCGHGEKEGIIFEDNQGYAKLVRPNALARFFKLFASQVECVLLNACYSEIQADAITLHIPYVIGMKKEIPDAAAIEFAVAFYDAIGNGKSIEFAYEFACSAIELEGIQGHLIPTLKVKSAHEKKIDCIVLCGGYSVRLWPLTKEDISKVLVPVAGKPVLAHVLDFVQDSPKIKTTILSVNQKFASQIQEFRDSYYNPQRHHPIKLIVEPTNNQQEKLGPIGALDFIISQSIPQDILVLGGDNLFGFQLNRFLQFGAKMACSCNALYQFQTKDGLEEYGVADIDSNSMLLSFQEKPERSKYNNVSTACYLFRKCDIEAIHTYIEKGGNTDSLGGFICWLNQQGSNLGCFSFSSFWYDVGTCETLLQANKHYLKHSLCDNMPDTTWNDPIQIDGRAKIAKSELGPNVYIGTGVEIYNSIISNSIIMKQCIIRNSDIHNSVIGPGSIIERQNITGVFAPKSRSTR